MSGVRHLAHVGRLASYREDAEGLPAHHSQARDREGLGRVALGHDQRALGAARAAWLGLGLGLGVALGLGLGIGREGVGLGLGWGLSLGLSLT